MAADFGSYTDFDSSEARAADDLHLLHVPFHVAFHLQAISLLNDRLGPTESRHRSLSNALRRLQDA